MPLGKKQHFELGQHLRRKYAIDQAFLSSDYKEEEVLIRSTYTSRTYLSSIYQIMGMYPDLYPTNEDYATYSIGDEEYLSKA